jgi:hypothetical protein
MRASIVAWSGGFKSEQARAIMDGNNEAVRDGNDQSKVEG